jgi:hypothetical protein
MHGVRQVQVVIFDRIDRLIIVGMQVTIAVIGIVRGCFGRGIVVEVPQLSCRNVGRVGYTLQAVAEEIAVI